MLLDWRIEGVARTIYRRDSLVNNAWVMHLGIQTFIFVVARRAGASMLLIAVGIALIYLPALLMSLLPLICRRFPLGRVVLALRILSGIGLLIAAFCPSLTGLAIAYAVMIGFGGMVDASYPAFLKAVYPPRSQANIMGSIFIERAVVVIAWLLGMGWILNQVQDIGASIRIIGLVGLCALLSATLYWPFRRVRETPAETAHAHAKPFANREFIYYLIALTIFGTGGIFLGVLTPKLYVNTFAFSDAQVGLLQMPLYVGQLLAFFYISRQRALRASNRVLALPYALVGVNALMLALAALVPALHHPGIQFTAAFAANLLNGLGSGLQAMCFYLVVNAMAGSASVLDYHASQNIVVGIRGLLVPFLAGALCEMHDLRPALYLSVALPLLAAVLALVLTVRHPAPAPAPAPVPAE